MGMFQRQVTDYIDAIACDGPGCFVSIFDDHPGASPSLCKVAEAKGWTKDESWKWYCPSCTAKRKYGI